MDRQERIALFRGIDVYPVTCEKLSSGRSNLRVLDGVIEGGARIIQLREKEYSERDFYQLALKFREVTAKSNVLLIINDHVDIALAVDADGVHLGQEDLPLQVARRLAPELLIGVSTHSLEQALEAQESGADYINIGPIFPTKTKEGASDFLGPDMIGLIRQNVQIPFTVMGGIDLSNIDQVLAHGARYVAMVTAITLAPDIPEKVRMIRQRIATFSCASPH
ncbi:MAG: thiamine phosphate synthase [Deltaproteobacteria bacterium]|nr:thiamine phosphate synthase [Deltaproteobacteria bacterium]